MSGQSAYQLPPIAEQDPIELDDMQERNPGLSRQARAPNAQHLQDAIQASHNRDQSENRGWRGLSQNAARDILRQHGIEITQANVEYLRRDWDYENAGCGGLVDAMRSERAGWGNFRADRIDLSGATSLGDARGLSLGQVQEAFEKRTEQIIREALQQATEDAKSDPKYKSVMELQGRRGFVDLEGQSDFNLDAQVVRFSQRKVASPSYRLAMNNFVTSYKALVDYLLTLQNGSGTAPSEDGEKTRLVELCSSFAEARGKLDAAWTALEDYRDQITAESRRIIDSAYSSANAQDTATRSRRTFAMGSVTLVSTLVGAALLYANYGLNWSHGG